MGCWGITAFESDAGLDAVCCIRRSLPKDGKLELDAVIQRLQQDSWNRPADVSEGISHTSPMALAEMMFQLMDHDLKVWAKIRSLASLLLFRHRKMHCNG